MGTLIKPTDHESALATQTSRALAAMLPALGETAFLNVEGQEEKLELPIMAVHLLIDVLEQIAQGKPVSIIPTDAVLTTQQAANILNVSRPHINKLIEKESLPHHMIGTHRRIRYDDLMQYKKKIDKKRDESLKQLSELSQQEEMGY